MRKLVIGIFAAALMGAPAAVAQDNDHHDNMGGPEHHDTMQGPEHHDNMGGMMMRHDEHHPIHHGWRHGDRLPQTYWHAQEVDWGHYHLRRPPHGYHWVRVDDDFVLVAIASGVILDTVFAQ
jgi:Ni/Co efflux regulator RcnB